MDFTNHSPRFTTVSGASRSAAYALVGLALAYLVVLSEAYLELTSQSSSIPRLATFDQRLFAARARPVSPIERLLTSREGRMNGGGTMRPAFTTESTGWDDLLKPLSPGEQARLTRQREGERLALLAWVRAGADRPSYEADCYLWHEPPLDQPMTANYLAASAGETAAPRHKSIRIRSLIHDRCEVCHSEQGRDERAQSFPFSSYENLAPFCQPEQSTQSPPIWFLMALFSQIPLALVSALALVSRPAAPRQLVLLAGLTLAAAVVALASWWLGKPGGAATPIAAASFTAAALGVLALLFLSVRRHLASFTGAPPAGEQNFANS